MFLSDHTLVQVVMCFPDNIITQCNWRLYSLFSHKFKKILGEIDSFLAINITPGISFYTIWETLKDYIRWRIISDNQYNQRSKRLSDKSQHILEIDSRYALP